MELVVVGPRFRAPLNNATPQALYQNHENVEDDDVQDGSDVGYGVYAFYSRLLEIDIVGLGLGQDEDGLVEVIRWEEIEGRDIDQKEVHSVGVGWEFDPEEGHVDENL